MKKRYFLLTPFILLSLSGCGKKEPETEADKVKAAFNGVEESFKKIDSSTSKKSSRPFGDVNYAPNRFDDENNEGVSSIYIDKNIIGHSVDDLSYNQPPMVQFQCLKKAYEKIGTNFEFGTKYYDNITGEVYIDFSTGYKDEAKKTENKYNYDYELGIKINVRDNGVIDANVSFDVKLSQGDVTYETVWYVDMYLDYKYEIKTPTYKLEMITSNNEKELPYLNRYTYENDYVYVNENQIVQWHKFCMDCSKKLVEDTTHVSFSDYVNEIGTEYRVDAPKAFKDGNLYKVQDMNQILEKAYGDDYFQKFDCKESKEKEDFLKEKGTKNSAIQDVYKDFSKIIGDDLAYDILCKEKDDHNNEGAKNIAGIRAMAIDGQTGAENYVVGDVTIESLFTGYLDGSGKNTRMDLWYTDASNGLIEKVVAFDDLEYFFTCGTSDNETNFYPYVNMTKDATILQAYDAIRNENNTDSVNEHCVIKVKDTRKKVEGTVAVIFGGDINEQYTTPELPKECVNLGIPSYEGRNVAYSLAKIEAFDDQDLTLIVDNTNQRELSRYIKKVVDNGFTKITSSLYGYDNIFKKNYGDNKTLFLIVHAGANFDTDNRVYIDAYLSPRPTTNNKSSTFPNELTQLVCPMFISNNAKFTYENDVLFVFNATEEERLNFEKNFYSSRTKPFVFDKEINDGRDYLRLTRKTIFDDGYYCYEVTTVANPNYVEPIDDQNTQEVNFLTLAGDFNQWNIEGKDQKYVFAQNGSGFQLPNVSLEAGQNFKMVANRSWDVSNESTEYGGFGYDDVDNIGEFGAAFAKGENGNIHVNENKVITIRATVSNGRLSFKFQ